MFTPIDAPENVFAGTVSGRLGNDEIDAIFRRLDALFETDEKVHLFIEVQNFQGLSSDAWMRDLSHGMRYLSRLKQFGRVAIVSEQGWIRSMSRLESALLPFVHYEVFTPDQRDAALAWVCGEGALKRPQALRMLATGSPDLIAFEVNGRITREALDTCFSDIRAAIGERTDARLLGRIVNYDGFDPAIMADRRYIELKFELMRKISRYAVLGGPGWLSSVIGLAAPLVKPDVRHFTLDDEDGARRWLSEAGHSAQADRPGPAL